VNGRWTLRFLSPLRGFHPWFVPLPTAHAVGYSMPSLSGLGDAGCRDYCWLRLLIACSDAEAGGRIEKVKLTIVNFKMVAGARREWTPSKMIEQEEREITEMRRLVTLFPLFAYVQIRPRICCLRLRRGAAAVMWSCD